jgi:hypothetical protein
VPCNGKSSEIEDTALDLPLFEFNIFEQLKKNSKCPLDNRVQETGSGLGSSPRNFWYGIRWLVQQWNFCLNA